MIIENVKVYTKDRQFEEGRIVIQNGRIAAAGADADLQAADDPEILDGEGCYAIPGLIDLHFHGCMGYDICDGTKEALAAIAAYEASVGVTAIAPATMTLPVDTLTHVLSVAAAYKKEAEKTLSKGADLVGINMEGPFISKVKKGAQNERYIIPCDEAICQQFLDASGGLVKFIGIAPEDNPNAVDFIKAVKDRVQVSLAHTNADYDTAMAAFEAGASHAVHLYNAMPAYTHRAPGVVGAVADCPQVDAEMICDGIHLHPSAVRTTFKMLGSDRIILISDSIRAAGLSDGRYMLGGLDVDVKGPYATLVSDGALAGSVTNLADCLRTVVQQMHLPLETAVACATINPARSLGIDAEYGSLEPGKKAHVVLLRSDLSLKTVIKDGQKIV